MANITWEDHEQTLLVVNLGRGWNWNSFDATLDQAYLMIEASLHTVDMIIGDEMLSEPLPAGSPIGHFLRAAQRMPTNLGRVMAIIGTDLTRVAINVLVQLNGKARERVVAVRSWEEAHRIIQEERMKSR